VDLTGKLFGDRYWINKKIGSGGMAEVYEATDKVLSRKVALKILHPSFSQDENFITRFRREAKAAANLTHPNIVAVHDWGQENSTYYIVMEYVTGKSLQDLIKESAPLPPRTAIDILNQVLNALSFAHKKGVIHRDVKPHNILITEEGLIKVTDFGIAQAKMSSEEEEPTVMGTAYYVSPEQAQGLPASEASDIYSAGVVLFQMLTGDVPFKGKSAVDIAIKHVNDPPPDPRSLNPSVPPSLAEVIAKALAKDPLDRFQTADEMREALNRIERGLPPTEDISMEKTAILRPREFKVPRRYPWAFIIVALFLVLLLGSLGGFYLWQRALFANRVAVPSLVGESFERARQILQERGLNLRVGGRKFSNTTPKNYILEQDPEPGTKLKKGETVTVILSKGVAMIKVPDVVGLDEADAGSVLGNKGLSVGKIEREYSKDYAEGVVISQDPEAGTKVPKGSSVDLVISRGVETVLVPNLISQSVDEATAALAQIGLKYKVKYEYDDIIPEGKVIRQNPLPGIEVEAGSLVEITVSKGSDKVIMPDVVGETEAAAKSELEGLGLSVEVTTTTAPPADIGKVVDQDPPSGTEITIGSTVKIWIGAAGP
jgi:serine/threonine-protein kinase